MIAALKTNGDGRVLRGYLGADLHDLMRHAHDADEAELIAIIVPQRHDPPSGVHEMGNDWLFVAV